MKQFPHHHQAVMPYFILEGAFQFIDFIKYVFQAKEVYLAKRDDTTVMHAEYQIGRSNLMLCDSTEQWRPQSCSLFVYVDNADETVRKALEQGSTVLMEVSDQSYGRSGGVIDPFGNVWWINSLQSK